MPEDLKVSQIGSSPLPPPFRGLQSPGDRKHCQIIFACYFRKSSNRTYMPPTAPMQWGKFHVSSNSLLIWFHVSSVCGIWNKMENWHYLFHFRLRLFRERRKTRKPKNERNAQTRTYPTFPFPREKDQAKPTVPWEPTLWMSFETCSKNSPWNNNSNSSKRRKRILWRIEMDTKTVQSVLKENTGPWICLGWSNIATCCSTMHKQITDRPPKFNCSV